MIQRIQTVYLLLILCVMFGMLNIPVVKTCDKVISCDLLLYINSFLIAFFSLLNIFQYKKRKLQIKYGFLILALLLLSYVIIFFNHLYPFNGVVDFLSFRISVLFPLIAMVLDILAIIAIRKDEKLVRSADRLR
ncbi:membrane protein [Bacteroidia bacterium]|nr:membrane protein [Synergistales bacterium]GHU64530.1 membrane protein [Bacteroidia bacterium]